MIREWGVDLLVPLAGLLLSVLILTVWMSPSREMMLPSAVLLAKLLVPKSIPVRKA